MIGRPGWVFFVVFFFVFMPILGNLVDGEIATPGSHLVASVTSAGGVINIGRSLVWDYNWLDPFPYYYFKYILWIIQAVTVFYIAKEALDYIRGRG